MLEKHFIKIELHCQKKKKKDCNTPPSPPFLTLLVSSPPAPCPPNRQYDQPNLHAPFLPHSSGVWVETPPLLCVTDEGKHHFTGPLDL